MRLLLLHAARIVFTWWFWALVALAGFLGWVSGYDVR